ncbi:hypothetical protein LIX60_30605 [Streptomyces sp. S07_1.15]|uniref:hypothetical protein n=1 Tax=Streptomyces sp. S07_1.15 TaxID=2873925 RepID=UPI001D13517F|nr:hypothetical protein [Streptomyces sp. S07_1.15]MCC3655734.1 hypothetical protein [Streptomyces sp. S07_1.15]
MDNTGPRRPPGGAQHIAPQEAAAPVPRIPPPDTAGYALGMALALRGWRYRIVNPPGEEYIQLRLPRGMRLHISGTSRDGRTAQLCHPTHEHASWQAWLTARRTRSAPQSVYDSSDQSPAPFGGDTASLITAVAALAVDLSRTRKGR